MDNVVDFATFRRYSSFLEKVEEFCSDHAHFLRDDVSPEDLFHPVADFFRRISAESFQPVWSDYVYAFCNLPSSVTHTKNIGDADYAKVPLTIVREVATIVGSNIYFSLLLDDGDPQEGFTEDFGKLMHFSTDSFSFHEKEFLSSLEGRKFIFDEEGRPWWKELRDNPDVYDMRLRTMLVGVKYTNTQNATLERNLLRMFIIDADRMYTNTHPLIGTSVDGYIFTPERAKKIADKKRRLNLQELFENFLSYAEDMLEDEEELVQEFRNMEYWEFINHLEKEKKHLSQRSGEPLCDMLLSWIDCFLADT